MDNLTPAEKSKITKAKNAEAKVEKAQKEREELAFAKRAAIVEKKEAKEVEDSRVATYINTRRSAVFTSKGKIYQHDTIELPVSEGDVNVSLKKV